MTVVFARERKRRFEAREHRGRSHGKMEAATAALYLQDQEHQGLLVTVRRWKRQGRIPPEPPEGINL